jgi:hypothetical protein
MSAVRELKMIHLISRFKTRKEQKRKIEKKERNICACIETINMTTGLSSREQLAYPFLDEWLKLANRNLGKCEGVSQYVT